MSLQCIPIIETRVPATAHLPHLPLGLESRLSLFFCLPSIIYPTSPPSNTSSNFAISASPSSPYSGKPPSSRSSSSPKRRMLRRLRVRKDPPESPPRIPIWPYKHTTTYKFYYKAHRSSVTVVVRRIMDLDDLGLFNSLTEEQIKELRRHPILSMPIETTNERKTYVKYLRQFDWGDAWEFTPEIKPDPPMTGEYIVTWMLHIMEAVRGVIEHMLATQVKRLRGKDTAVMPMPETRW